MTTKTHLQALAAHYPSLLVSGVAHGAIKEIERLEALVLPTYLAGAWDANTLWDDVERKRQNAEANERAWREVAQKAQSELERVREAAYSTTQADAVFGVQHEKTCDNCKFRNRRVWCAECTRNPAWTDLWEPQ